MRQLLSIGEVSKMKNITVKALRYYHKMGILIPEYIDEDSGYRYYKMEQLVHIDIIKGCRALGTRITELQEIFKSCNTDKLLKFLELKRAEAEEGICKLQEIIENIDDLNERVRYGQKLVEDEDLVIRFFEERKVVVVPCREVGSLKELIYYSDLEKELGHRELTKKRDWGMIYDLQIEGGIWPKYVFNHVETDLTPKEDELIRILPAGHYIVLNYHRDNEDKQREKLITYMKQRGIEKVQIIEIDLLNDFFDTSYYSCQIQVLVER